jgi:hypothetical protein
MNKIEKQCECIKLSIGAYTLKAQYWMANAHFEESTTAAIESIRRAKAFVDLTDEATEQYKQLIHQT